MAAPTNAAFVKKVLANPEPSTHGTYRRIPRDGTGLDAVAGKLHVSEFVLYGVFVDHVLGGMAQFDQPCATTTTNGFFSAPLTRAPLPITCRQPRSE